MKLVAGAILVLAGAILASATMIGTDIRNNTGRAPYTESGYGYYYGIPLAIVGGVLMIAGYRSDQAGKGST